MVQSSCGLLTRKLRDANSKMKKEERKEGRERNLEGLMKDVMKM